MGGSYVRPAVIVSYIYYEIAASEFAGTNAQFIIQVSVGVPSGINKVWLSQHVTNLGQVWVNLGMLVLNVTDRRPGKFYPPATVVDAMVGCVQRILPLSTPYRRR